MLLLFSIFFLLRPSICLNHSTNTEASSEKNHQKSASHINVASSPSITKSHQSIHHPYHSSELVNLTQSSPIPQFASPHNHQHNQYHFPQPFHPVSIYSIKLTQSPKPTPTYKNSIKQDQPDLPITHSNHQRRSLNPRDQSPQWPGTDTVYATKTVFVSQPSQPTTVFVSNGQIIHPSPTPYPGSTSNGQNTWVAPNGNPNIVVATVTAYSSAQRFAWDGFRSNSCFKIFLFVNLIHLFIIFGFGLVNNFGF